MEKSQAKVYRENSDFQKEDGLKLISSVSFHNNMKVLDIGCGTGYLTSVLAKEVGKTGSVLGIDPDMTRVMAAKNTYSSFDNLTFQTGSAEDIPKDDYDIVFSNYVFHWVEDKVKAFRDIFCCLKPFGSFIVCFEINLSHFVLDFINLLESNRANEVKSKLFFLTTDEIEEIASSCGFAIKYKEITNRCFKFENFESFENCCYGGFGGLVDSKFMDAEKYQELKRISGKGEIEQELCTIVSYIFTKTQ